MSQENQKDIERRERLHEWFTSNPEIWEDIVQELNISHHNENIKLRARTAECREWSAGWVSSHEYVLDLERYYKKVWTPPNKT